MTNKNMNIKQITTTLVALAILAIPAVTFANIYQYIDSGGNVQSIQANSPSEALATAPNLGLHSGVILVTNNTSLTN